MKKFHDIYSFSPIYGNEFNPSTWYEKNLNTHENLVTDTFAVGISSEDDSKKLLRSIFLRLPIYAKGETSWITNGVKEESMDCFKDRSSGITIIGTVMAFKSNIVKEKGKFISSHIYGLNFESDKTYDFIQYVEKDGNFKKDAIDQIKEELFNRYYVSMIATAKYMDLHDIEKVEKCFPLIGMGAYLSKLQETAKKYFFEINIEALCNALRKIRSEQKDISVRLFAYEQKDINALNSLKISIEEFFTYEKGDLFSFKEIEDDLIQKDKKGYILGRDGRCLEVVNAWDNLSLIGNGQTEDPTVDGFYVSGSKNKYLRNTSFLFNLFITNFRLACNGVYSISQEFEYKNIKKIESKYIKDIFEERKNIFKEWYFNKLKEINILI